MEIQDIERPAFNSTEVQQIVTTHYGLSGVLRELPSERDQNFHVKTDSGKEYVLKIASRLENLETLEFQNSALKHLAGCCDVSAVPPLISSINGREIEQVRSSDGTDHFVRLMSYLPGRVLAKVNPHSPELLYDFGRFLGSITRGLANFDHPAAHRDFYWDLKQASPVIRKYVGSVSGSERRKLVHYFLRLYESLVLPRIDQLRTSVIHNDANDYNVLVNHPHTDKARFFGIIDLGDMVFSSTINELAIAIAYAILDKPDPLSVAQHIISGYQSIIPLSEPELDALFVLICTRLAMSVSIAAHQQKLEPDNEYLSVSQRSAWSALSLLKEIHPRYATFCFRGAAGLEPCPHSSDIVEWLRTNSPQLSSPIGLILTETNCTVIDLSVGSTYVATPHQLADHKIFGDLVSRELENAGVEVGIGRYDEPRLIYTGAQYRSYADESRTVHLATDLFVKAGSPVYAVCNGKIHSFADNAKPYDNGPTVVIEHTTAPGKTPFYTLYAHLTRGSLTRLGPGISVKSGEFIGRVGDYPDNGGWPPHLHFQLIVDMLDKEGDFFGVAPPSKREIWKSISPDSNIILQIPESVFPMPLLSRDDILSTRKKRISGALSVSYKNPLTIVRGHMQYLYDENGREYLDARNNVPQVGHSNPTIVETLARQASVLNTNTRYLHEGLVRYANRLCSKLPASLSVCFFVNSGSEANELALRLARTHTKQKDIIAIDGAYHGNTSALIDISSYKHNGPGGEGAPPHAHIVRMPDTYRGEYRGLDAASKYAQDVLETIESIRKQGKGLAAFICEPLMACGGQIVFPDGYLKQCYEYVRKAGGVCIADEVQTGFGRVGTHFWGFETQGVEPDIVTMGKSIGNGHPIGAVVTTPEIAESFSTGMEFFSTTGGNTVSCAVGMAVLDVIDRFELQKNALSVGNHLLQQLNSLKENHPIIGDVRGIGLFIGVELVRNSVTLEPAEEEARYVVERMKDLGVLIGLEGRLNTVLMIKPPLVFTKENADQLVGVLERVLQEDPVVSGH